MNLYLLRHGLAVEPGAGGHASDADRPLTPEGRRKLKQAAAGIQALRLECDLIMTSPYLRAKQTAEIVAQALKLEEKLQFCPQLAPEGTSSGLIQVLRQLRPRPEAAMLVGHEPGLSRLISLLVWGDTGGMVVMKKAGLCALSIEAIRHGRCAALEWLLTGGQLRRMAG